MFKKIAFRLASLLPLHLNPIATSRGRIRISRYLKYLPELGINIEIDPNQHLDKCYAFNVFDKKSLAFLSGFSSECDIFMDIGANLGIYGLALSSMSEHLVSALIEPDPYSIAKIRRNIEINPKLSERIKCLDCAAGVDRNGIDLMINTVGNRGGSSVCIDQREWTKEEKNTVFHVRTLTILDMMEELDFNPSTKWFCKLDIEGYEYPVVKKFLEQSKPWQLPLAIVVEWTGRGVTGSSGETSIELLLNNGYRLAGREGENFFLEKI